MSILATCTFTTHFEQLGTLKKNQSALFLGPSQRTLNILKNALIDHINAL